VEMRKTSGGKCGGRRDVEMKEHKGSASTTQLESCATRTLCPISEEGGLEVE